MGRLEIRVDRDFSATGSARLERAIASLVENLGWPFTMVKVARPFWHAAVRPVREDRTFTAVKVFRSAVWRRPVINRCRVMENAERTKKQQTAGRSCFARTYSISVAKPPAPAIHQQPGNSSRLQAFTAVSTRSCRRLPPSCLESGIAAGKDPQLGR